MKQNNYMKTVKILLATTLGFFLLASCSNKSGIKSSQDKVATAENTVINDSTNVIYFAGGCFWGTEHFFKQVNGVTTTDVGFANGHTENPTYEDVIGEDTGYAETVKVVYNPKKVDLNLLLDLYFMTIDPTSLNKQGNDYGDQYRTGIYYTSDKQLPFIKERIKKEAVKYNQPIVVEVSPLEKYYKAEDYHQDYLENNPGGYCHINPALFQVAKDANKKK